MSFVSFAGVFDVAAEVHCLSYAVNEERITSQGKISKICVPAALLFYVM